MQRFSTITPFTVFTELCPFVNCDHPSIDPAELETQTVGSALGWSQFTKGHNSIKTVNGVMVLILSYHLMMLYICTTFQENISKDFRAIERMWFVY